LMSFDIFFKPCRFVGNPIVKKNPFTGQVQSSVPNQPLTADEVKALQTVLRKANARGPDKHGCYVLTLADGGSAEVFGKNLSDSCTVALQELSPDLSHFLMELLKAGNWCMQPAMENSMAIVSTQDSVKGAPKDFPEIVVCNSADELGILLSDGLQAWQQYRDQVTGGDT
jgi:hypothetical protein